MISLVFILYSFRMFYGYLFSYCCYGNHGELEGKKRQTLEEKKTVTSTLLLLNRPSCCLAFFLRLPFLYRSFGWFIVVFFFFFHYYPYIVHYPRLWTRSNNLFIYFYCKFFLFWLFFFVFIQLSVSYIWKKNDRFYTITDRRSEKKKEK